MEARSRHKLILIGFMGTGKSSVSRMLAEKLGWERLDADEEIERSENREIRTIFSEEGEEAFRDIESRELQKLMERPEPAVVATGGGAVLRDNNRDVMLSNGYVVALKASPDNIISRVTLDKSRPLLQGDVAGRVHRLLEQRKGAYDFAHLSIDTTGLSIEEVVDEIVREWNVYCSSQ